MNTATKVPNGKQCLSVEQRGDKFILASKKGSTKSRFELTRRQAQALVEVLTAKLRRTEARSEPQPEDVSWRDPEIM